MLELIRRGLSPHEVRVCELLVSGLNYREIGNRLGTAPANVSASFRRVCDKAGIPRNKLLLGIYLKTGRRMR